ncbi:unnamed protein product [Alopecurus aequalis]
MLTMLTPPRPSHRPPKSDCRGVAACFPQPVNQDQAVFLADLIKKANARRCKKEEKMQELVYRGSDGDIDILRHVFRWDKAPYQFVFDNGLYIQLRQRDLSDTHCFNLEDYVKSGMRRLDTRRETKHGFIITTLNSSWFPNYVKPDSSDTVYRYEIYAPGGILVSQTLGDSYRYSDAQDEVAFVYGIARQYIRSAQVFQLSNNKGNQECERMDSNIYINPTFNPQSSPPRTNSQLLVHGSSHGAHNKPLDDAILEYYKVGVTNLDSYIDAAFRCKGWTQAYIFIKTEESLRLDRLCTIHH